MNAICLIINKNTETTKLKIHFWPILSYLSYRKEERNTNLSNSSQLQITIARTTLFDSYICLKKTYINIVEPSMMYVYCTTKTHCLLSILFAIISRENVETIGICEK